MRKKGTRLWVEFQGERYYLDRDGYFKTCRSRGCRLLHGDIWEAHTGPSPPGWQVRHQAQRLRNDPADMEALSVSDHTKAHDPKGIAVPGVWERQCPECGEVFTTHGPAGKYCTPVCRRRAWRKRQKIRQAQA